MNPVHDEAMKSLAAGVVARRLYFPEHPAVAACTRSAFDAFSKALAERSDLAFHLVEKRVLGPDGSLLSSADIRAGLFEPMVKLGRSSLSVSKGITLSEIQSLINTLGSESPELPALPHIRFGSAEVADGAPSRGEAEPPPPALELVAAYRTAWEPSEQSGSVRASDLEVAAAGVYAAVTSAHGAVLQLATLKSHDEYTYVHTINVALLAAALAEACGLSVDQVHQITQAALMHDLGKRVIPLSILNKSGNLDENERRIMNRHPVEGARLLMGQPSIPDFATVVAFEHHMHLDGSGYPSRAKNWKPNLAAQIVQQADVFDALRTHRPYRAAMSTEKASAILREGSGTKYDPSLVEVFVTRIANRSSPGLGDTKGSAAA